MCVEYVYQIYLFQHQLKTKSKQILKIIVLVEKLNLLSFSKGTPRSNKKGNKLTRMMLFRLSFPFPHHFRYIVFVAVFVSVRPGTISWTILNNSIFVIITYFHTYLSTSIVFFGIMNVLVYESLFST
jgi:hypothetical protein